MIATYRPDLDIDAVCDALSSPAEPPFSAWRLGGRRPHPIPRGRDAITWCLPRAELPAGSEVLLPALLGDSVPSAVLQAGFRPVTYGVHADTLEPSVESCEAALTSACKAVVVPHLFGRPADIRRFRELADANGLLLIEDCAHWLNDEPGPGGEGATGDVCLYR